MMYLQELWNAKTEEDSLNLGWMIMKVHIAETVGGSLLSFIEKIALDQGGPPKPVTDAFDKLALIGPGGTLTEDEINELRKRIICNHELYASVSPDAFVLKYLPTECDSKLQQNLYGTSAHHVGVKLLHDIVDGECYMSEYDRLNGHIADGDAEGKIINFDLQYLIARIDWEHCQLVAKYGKLNTKGEAQRIFHETESMFTWNGKSFALKAQAFKILQYLWKHRNCSREDLRINVWDRPTLADDALKKAIARTNSLIDGSGFFIELSTSLENIALKEPPAE
jgi:hypothetical protein